MHNWVNFGLESHNSGFLLTKGLQTEVNGTAKHSTPNVIMPHTLLYLTIIPSLQKVDQWLPVSQREYMLGDMSPCPSSDASPRDSLRQISSWAPSHSKDLITESIDMLKQIIGHATGLPLRVVPYIGNLVSWVNLWETTRMSI